MSKPVQFEEYNCGFPFAEMLLPWFFAGTLWPGLVAILLHLQEPIWGEGPLTGLFSIPAKNTYSLEITANLKWLAANCNCNLNAGSRIPGHFSTVPVLSESVYSLRGERGRGGVGDWQKTIIQQSEVMLIVRQIIHLISLNCNRFLPALVDNAS